MQFSSKRSLWDSSLCFSSSSAARSTILSHRWCHQGQVAEGSGEGERKEKSGSQMKARKIHIGLFRVGLGVTDDSHSFFPFKSYLWWWVKFWGVILSGLLGITIIQKRKAVFSPWLLLWLLWCCVTIVGYCNTNSHYYYDCIRNCWYMLVLYNHYLL